MLYTQTFLKSDAHFANQNENYSMSCVHPPQLPYWERKKKKKWVKEIKCTKKKEHKKDEAQEAVIYSFGKFFCDKKNLELFVPNM